MVEWESDWLRDYTLWTARTAAGYTSEKKKSTL